jgi:acyl-CoA synthetase (NDP forming)
MGIYCPKSRLSFDEGFPKESGSVAFISQSGGLAFYIVQESVYHGIRFSKVVSYGNASDINETELLHYLTQDAETEIITAYIEGVKDGKAFLQALKEAAAAKPVIILKGGSSEAGARGTLSHTGSLAGAETTWEALFGQSGAIRVFSPDELIDMMVSFSFFHQHPKGKRVAIIGFGGGASVQAADECEKAGLSVPSLPQEIKERLGNSALAPGSIFKNPIDIVGNFTHPGEVDHIIRTVADWAEVDFLIFHFLLGVGGFGLKDLMLYRSTFQEVLATAKELNKPVVFVLSSVNLPFWQEEAFQFQQELLTAGFPVYHSAGQAAQAMNRLFDRH